MNLSKLLVAHAVITAAAGAVLIAAPSLIPGAVGVHLDPDAYLVAYLLGAAELGIAYLSFFARRLTDVDALRLVATTFIVFHVATAGVELYAFARGTEPTILANVALRAAVVALFAHYAPRRTAAVDTHERE